MCGPSHFHLEDVWIMYLLFYWMSQHNKKKSVQAQIKEFELGLSIPYCNDNRKELERNKLISILSMR